MPHVAPFIHDVEGKDLKATMIVMKRIKPYLDEQIQNNNVQQVEYKTQHDKYREVAGKLSDSTDAEESARLMKQRES